MAFTDGGFHEARERGKDVDRGVDAFVVELAVDEDLAFSDVTRQVGDRMSDIWKSSQMMKLSA